MYNLYVRWACMFVCTRLPTRVFLEIREYLFICLYMHSSFQISLLKAAKSAVIEDVRRCLELGANPNTLNQVRSSTGQSANNQLTNHSHE